MAFLQKLDDVNTPFERRANILQQRKVRTSNSFLDKGPDQTSADWILRRKDELVLKLTSKLS